MVVSSLGAPSSARVADCHVTPPTLVTHPEFTLFSMVIRVPGTMHGISEFRLREFRRIQQPQMRKKYPANVRPARS